MNLSPEELQAKLRGMLSFPVTPMTAEYEVDVPRYREHVQYMLEGKPGALFVCGGTGEFYSLTPSEYQALVRAAVEEVAGALPVVVGIGYGTALAKEFAATAEDEGADGVLVLPPYLLIAEQEGLYQHYRSIAGSTRLGVILYQRDNALFSPNTVAGLAEIPNVIGLKDGWGDMERLLRIRLAADRLLFMNGMPTAELSAPAFSGAGVDLYSSAVYNFVPQLATAFLEAFERRDTDEMNRLLDGFYRPFAQLRDRVRGYAVALIKAGLAVRDMPVGPVRPPLIAPTREHEAELQKIIKRGLSLLEPEREGR